MVSINDNAWQWFLSLTPDQQMNTLALILSPAALSIAGTILLVSSIRNVYNPTDKQAWLIAICLSSFLGVIVLYVMKGFINEALRYDLYKTESLVAAAVLTPIMNHIVFKLVIALTRVCYYVGLSIPEKHTFGWMGVPIRKLATSLYYTVTGKSMIIKIKNSETGEEKCVTQTRMSGENE